MAQATFSVRMDDNLKKQFEELCNEFGMNMSTAINVFARAVVRQRKIPFEISANNPAITSEGAMEVFAALRAQASEKYPDGLSIEEIDEEIRKVRLGEE